MPVKSNSELAAFFNTGDQPSETEFGHLVDTILPPALSLATVTGAVSLSAATHAYRTVFIGAADVAGGGLTGNLEATLPSTIVVDEWYHFVGFGDLSGDDGHDFKITTGTNGSQFFQGAITHLDTTADGASTTTASNILFHGNGTSHDFINIDVAGAFDIWVHAKSSTLWYAWGTVTKEGVGTNMFHTAAS
tara:strand:+ start:106 stop:678 length:573 start_codon:yes stop_codon:yes gene_type:complete